MENQVSRITEPADGLADGVPPAGPGLDPQQQSQGDQLETIQSQRPASLAEQPPDDPLEPDPQRQSPDDQIETILFRRPSTFAELPPEVLEHIFKHVPASYRSVVAAVCYPWRQAFLETSSCWAGIQLGKNSNCFSTVSLSTRPTDYLPLSHIQEVNFTPTIPAAVCMQSDQLRAIPYQWLGRILRHAPKLKRLDMSSLVVRDENIAAFR